MTIQRVGGETMVLYADLRERLEIFETIRSMASLPGEFTTKKVKGCLYHYYQAALPGGRVQFYLGRDSDAIHGGSRVRMAIPDVRADVPAAIESLRMGFFPVPRFSNKEPSTSYAIRGKTLRIDLVTPMRGGQGKPVSIHRFNAAAQPLKYLDYLIEDPVSAAMISGTPCLVKVPQPARFALHKLIISRERDVSSAAKKKKDVLQAIALLEVLREDMPAEIERAMDAISKQAGSWTKNLQMTCKEYGIKL